jgi:hypothetical protein
MVALVDALEILLIHDMLPITQGLLISMLFVFKKLLMRSMPRTQAIYHLATVTLSARNMSAAFRFEKFIEFWPIRSAFDALPLLDTH